MTRYLFYLLIVSLFISGCENRYDKVRKHLWKYSDGSYIGDFLDFSDSNYYAIDKKLTIYRKDKKVAEIVKVNNHHMIIKTTDRKEGVYINKGDHDHQNY